jgi:hypothetical protein
MATRRRRGGEARPGQDPDPKLHPAAANLCRALPVGLLLAAGAALRLYGLNWDDGQWLHPDERQIYFIVGGLGWPHSLAEALSPDSPLNPHFFSYGSLPFYLLKLVATLLAPFGAFVRNVDNLHLIGRPLSALFDVGTIYLTYRLARRLDIGYRILAAALVGFAVLHVQLAHFYTVDPLLTFFVMLTLNLAADVAQGGGWQRRVALGVAFGLALATKVSALPLILAVYVAHSAQGARSSAQYPLANDQSPAAHPRSRTRNLVSNILRLLPTLAVAGAVFFLAQPYALIDWRTFLTQTIRETQIARGMLDVPYTLQFAGTLPVLYSVWQTAFWGLGLPLGLVAWAGLAAVLIRWLRHGPWPEALILAWAGPYLVITGLLYSRYLRYMLPLAPILCLGAAWLLENLHRRAPRDVGRWIVDIGRWSVVILSLVYTLVFVSVYAMPHSWITASAWIYRHIPAGSTLSVEHWDTTLPLPLEMEGTSWRASQYDTRVLPLYDEPDGAIKWEALSGDLAASDYLVIASRRLYGSILRTPERYPVASRYYDLLFAGELGFELVGEFTRGPAWLNPPISPLPGAAPALFRPDESFVVYDHPRALIFRNIQHLPAAELLRRLGVGG